MAQRRTPSRLTNLAPRMTVLNAATAKVPDKVAEPFYLSAAWRGLMADLLTRRGRQCEDCGRTGCRIFGDHVRELKDGGSALDPANVRLLCGSCHGLKTAAVRAARVLARHARA